MGDDLQEVDARPARGRTVLRLHRAHGAEQIRLVDDHYVKARFLTIRRWLRSEDGFIPTREGVTVRLGELDVFVHVLLELVDDLDIPLSEHLTEALEKAEENATRRSPAPDVDLSPPEPDEALEARMQAFEERAAAMLGEAGGT